MQPWNRSLYDQAAAHTVGGSTPDSTAYTNFIARTTGLDATHLAAYKGLLDGLTTDGLFNSDGTSNFFDVLYVFATQDTTTAKFSLVNGTYNLTEPSSAPTHTQDRGYIAGAAGFVLATTYNPGNVASNFIQNSAHLALWNLTNSTASAPAAGNGDGSSAQTQIYIDLASQLYIRINDNAGNGGVAVSDPRGMLIGSRSSSSSIDYSQNGSDMSGSPVTNTSAAITNASFEILRATGSSTDTVHQLAMCSLGAHLNSTRRGLYYSRMRTFMTAVGVP